MTSTTTSTATEKTITIGAHVMVTDQYQGGGRFGRDGNEGPYTVVGELGRGDWYLAKGHHTPTPPKSEWDLIGNVSRIETR